MAPRRVRWKFGTRTSPSNNPNPHLRPSPWAASRGSADKDKAEKDKESDSGPVSSSDEGSDGMGGRQRGQQSCGNWCMSCCMLLLLLLSANFAGHYYPFLWSPLERQRLLRDWVALSQVLEDISREDGDVREMRLRGMEAELAAMNRMAKSPWRDVGSQGSFGEVASGRGAIASSSRSSIRLRRASEGREVGGEMSVEWVAGQEDSRWRTEYVRDVQIRVAEEPMCEGIVPAEFFKQDVSTPITDIADLLRPNQRVLVFLPRHGLGNSLRGFVSAFVYAALSGRRLVRFHGAEHAKVYDLLCEAFECGFDAVRWRNETGHMPMEIYRKLTMMQPMYFLEIYKSLTAIAATLQSDYPLMATRSGSHFDLFWHRSPRLRACVYAAFKCDSLWCVHSRAMFSLIGRKGPTKALEGVLNEVFRHTGGENGVKKTPADVPPPGKFVEFDVALHFRTRTLAIEKAVKQDSEQYAAAECQDKDEGAANRPKFLRHCLWDCIVLILKTLKESMHLGDNQKKELSIFLATDDEALRPVFVEKIKKFGTIYFSTGKVLHTSKTGGSSFERLPTMAEYYFMSKADTLIEAGSYISTFAYFASLLGNGTLTGINMKEGGCRLRIEHKAERQV